MKIDSPRFGSLDVASNKVIAFPAGLPGFEDSKRFSLVELEGDAQAVAVLQSVDQPDLAFVVTTPDLLGLHYEFTLTEDEVATLKVSSVNDVAVMIILRRNEDEAPHRRDTDPALKASLMAPLVINAQSMIGLQKVIAKLGCEVTLRSAA